MNPSIPKVVNVNKVPFDTYIGRRFGGYEASKWANPFIIGKHGTRDEVIAKYETYVKGSPELMAALPELRGKTLGCWCKGTEGFVNVACHGDVLVSLLLDEAAKQVVNELTGGALALPSAEVVIDVVSTPVMTPLAEGPLRGFSPNILHIDDAVFIPAPQSTSSCSRVPDTLALFTTHYSYTKSTLTLEEAGKTKPGGAPSIVDIARENHLKQVVIVDETIDAFMAEAYKNLAKPFKPEKPKALADYVKEAQGSREKTNDDDRAKGQAALDAATAKYEREKSWYTEPIQLVYGVRIAVVPDMAVKDDESTKQESNVIIFLLNSQGYSDVLKLWNTAWTTGKHDDHGRLDWATLKRLWTPNLALALPFFSSFIARNQLTFSSIVPDFPVTPWVFREIDSQLPFSSLIDSAIDQYAAQTGATVQPVKTIYYLDGDKGFENYVIFRARSTRSRGKAGTFSSPNVDNLASNRFSLAAYKEITS